MGTTRNQEELNQIGKRLREAREALGLSQKELREELGVIASTWSHWETGKRIPVVMAKLYRLHKVSLDWIYAGDRKGPCAIK